MKKRAVKTDYRRRMKLLKSGLPRLVIRKTNRYIIGMIVEYSPSGDRTSKLITSKSLKKYGWELGLKNTPAAYLTGFLIGKTGGVKEAIVDKGRHTMSKGSFIRYFIKGALDAGMDLHVKEMDIDKERMVGKHILDYYSKDSSKFSELGDKIKLITDEFNKVIEKINQENGR